MARARKPLPDGGRPTTKAELAALEEKVRGGTEARPGVYWMTSVSGGVLYVGKSKRVRERLLSYFKKPRHHKGARILRETRDVHVSYTPSEFAALREELRLIKLHRPRFNVSRKRDAEHYAFLRVSVGPAPKVTVERGGALGEGFFYGPFIGPELVAEAARELSDALGLRDCDDKVPLHFKEANKPIPLGLRAPDCIRHEVGKCLGPCVAACDAEDYGARVASAREFLEGKSEGLVARFRASMDAAKRDLEYERAALYRDRLQKLERLQSQFGKLRFELESLTFLYAVLGHAGDDRLYLVRRGTVRAEAPLPRSTADRIALQSLIDRVYGDRDAPGAPVRTHEIEELLVLTEWFRRHPEESQNTSKPLVS